MKSSFCCLCYLLLTTSQVILLLGKIETSLASAAAASEDELPASSGASSAVSGSRTARMDNQVTPFWAARGKRLPSGLCDCSNNGKNEEDQQQQGESSNSLFELRKEPAGLSYLPVPISASHTESRQGVDFGMKSRYIKNFTPLQEMLYYDWVNQVPKRADKAADDNTPFWAARG